MDALQTFHAQIAEALGSHDHATIALASTATLVLVTLFMFVAGGKSKAQATREVIMKDRRSIEKYKGP